MTQIDVKHIGIPNICFSLTDNNDPREVKYSTQRKELGFDDSETWSLSDTICRFTIPRLKRFKVVASYIPSNISQSDWISIIDKILISLELIVRDNGSRIWTDDEQKQVDIGLDLFREYFLSLWW